MNKDCELIKDLATRLNIHIHTFNDKLNPLWKISRSRDKIYYGIAEIARVGCSFRLRRIRPGR